MLLIRAFNETGDCWLDARRKDWDDAQPLLDQLAELCPESKVSIVDLRNGRVEHRERTASA